jgi:RHS repeat-associated protein
VLGSNPYPANIYAYDPWGKRVMSGYSPNYLNPQPTYNYTFYGITGQKLAMVKCNGSNYPAYPTCAIVGQNVYFGKKLITAGGVNVLTDRLGSVRANGQGESFAYYPYGEERTNRVDGREKFGTYFRDAIGQDYADQRYYGSGTGSFFSPDPDSGSGNAGGPLTWNQYSYANGDPINHWDPQGLDGVCGPFGYWMGEGCYGGNGGAPSSGPAYGCNDDWATFGEGCTMGDNAGVGCYGNGNGLLGEPDPGCPTGGGGGDDIGPAPAPPLTCGYTGAKTKNGSFMDVDTPSGSGNAFVDPISLKFQANGGTGSYTFSVTQTAASAGTATYSSGYSITFPGTVSPDPPLASQSVQNGSKLTFSDSPGVWSFLHGGVLTAANVTDTLQTIVTVTSGAQTVTCATVTWTATVIGTLGKHGKLRIGGKAKVVNVVQGGGAQ